MKLIGMLDSPFVRRVAVLFAARGIAFTHESVSVFRHMDRFGAVNPLFKAPTLVTDDGTVLMESSVILHWAEGVTGQNFLPPEPGLRTRAARLTALGLVAMEKAVQIEYERKRPEAERSAAWQARVVEQLTTSWSLIESELTGGEADPLSLEGITATVAWGFGRFVTPLHAPPERFSRLAAYAGRAEELPEYRRFPVNAV